MWEGIWGTLFSGIVMVLFSHISLGELFNCNFIESCKMIYNNTNLLLAMMVTALCIAPFNYFGISITKQSSALHRTLICTCRMVVVWVVSLGLQW